MRAFSPPASLGLARLVVLVLGLGIALVLPAGVARAGVHRASDPHALVERGVGLYRDASYAEAVATLEQARQGALAPEERLECSFYLAAGYVALGSTDAARRELRALLEAQPGYELPQYTSPKVAALFAEVQDQLAHLPRLRALPPVRRGPGRIELWFESANAGGTAYGAARWRWRGDREFREAPLSHERGKLEATLEVDRGGTLEYFAEARGPSGLAQVASADRPLELPVAAAPGATSATRAAAIAGANAISAQPAARKRDLVHAWWLWTTVGVVAAAGVGVGLYFALRPSGGTADAVLNFQVQ